MNRDGAPTRRIDDSVSHRAWRTGLLRQGQHDGKRGSTTGAVAGDGNRTVVPFDEVPGNRQTESESMRGLLKRFITLPKSIKHEWQDVRRNPVASVRHRHPGFTLGHRQSDGNLTRTLVIQSSRPTRWCRKAEGEGPSTETLAAYPAAHGVQADGLMRSEHGWCRVAGVDDTKRRSRPACRPRLAWRGTRGPAPSCDLSRCSWSARLEFGGHGHHSAP
jgi:hypothetical protein